MEILTPRRKSDKEFDERISEAFYRKTKKEGKSKTTTYREIAEEEGCGTTRVQNHLKLMKII